MINNLSGMYVQRFYSTLRCCVESYTILVYDVVCRRNVLPRWCVWFYITMVHDVVWIQTSSVKNISFWTDTPFLDGLSIIPILVSLVIVNHPTSIFPWISQMHSTWRVVFFVTLGCTMSCGSVDLILDLTWFWSRIQITYLANFRPGVWFPTSQFLGLGFDSGPGHFVTCL